jgi:hypothetical protein
MCPLGEDRIMGEDNPVDEDRYESGDKSEIEEVNDGMLIKIGRD